MAIQLIEVQDVAGGYRLRFFPDGEGAARYLSERCAARGWQAGEPAASADPGFKALSMTIRGATAADLRAELEGDPAFDLSCCRMAEAPLLAGERAPSHVPAPRSPGEG
jgi:hypothetical protein